MNDADRKVMQQGLEALTLANADTMLYDGHPGKFADAIAALRTQLAAPSVDQAELVLLGLEAAAKACEIGTAFAKAIRAIDPADVLTKREAT